MEKFRKILVCNRGEIARRVLRTARRMGITGAVVYSEPDAASLAVAEADEAYPLGGTSAGESYLNIDKIMQVIQENDVDLVHPGYGFLSENADFVGALEQAGVAFAGAGFEVIRTMGDKIAARAAAEQAGVRVVPGVGSVVTDPAAALETAGRIGFPVMLKAAAGGGGKGMRVVTRGAELEDTFNMASSEAVRSFGDGRMFVEKFIVNPRHIEVQVLADTHGNVIALGERECSLQRRHQKVFEEAPSAFLSEEVRQAMHAEACQLARAVGYVSAGTVEFIVEQDQSFYFLEMNTRLQVEHPVTERIFGDIDLVEWMIRIAGGEKLDSRLAELKPKGHAIEARIYAEDPEAGFLPSAGRVSLYRPPAEADDLRLDDAIGEGSTVPMEYDPMIGKLIAYGADRPAALKRIQQALAEFQIGGIRNNLLFLEHLARSAPMETFEIHTGLLDELYTADGQFVVPDDTITAVGLCALAALSNRSDRRAVGSGSEYRAGSVLCGFVAGEDGWQETQMTREAGDDLSVILADQSVLSLRDGGYDHRGGVVEIRKGQKTTTHHVRMRPGTFQGGYQIEWCGQRLEAVILPERLAVYQRLMPLPPTEADEPCLRLAMPGTLLRLHVAVGDKVEPGQPLAVIEAMKMENLLVASRHTTVASIEAELNSSLAVGDVLMNFTD